MCNRIKKSAKQDVQDKLDVQKQVRCAKTSKMCDKACLFVSKSWLKSKSKKKIKKSWFIFFVHIAQP